MRSYVFSCNKSKNLQKFRKYLQKSKYFMQKAAAVSVILFPNATAF